MPGNLPAVSNRNSMDKPIDVRVYDFFAGCGGASRGFQDAGMKIAFGLDRDADAQKTFQANFPDAHFESTDICKVNRDEIRRRVEAEPCPVLFSGCAPCQPFTKQVTRRPKPEEDERVPLLAHFAGLVDYCRPDLVFIENVPGLQNVKGDSTPFHNFLDQLKKIGYQVKHKSVKLARYGVPQSRRRLVLVASRHGKINLPKETHGPGTSQEQYSTVRDWIEDLPPIKAGEEHKDVPNHRAAQLSPRNLERIAATPEGGGNRDWPQHLMLECHKGFSGYSDVYGRMAWDASASGLTTRCISYSNGRFGHPEQNRAISIREAACLQTFPVDFVFQGSMGSMARQIGNAVPVLLAKLIGHEFIKHLEEVGRPR